MITVADPQILWNDGFYPLVDVTIPDGSYWKPKHPGGAERPQPRHRPGLRPVRRAARADQPGAAQRGRLLLLAALHVLRALLDRRAEGRVVPALLDRLRRHPRPAARRRAGRSFAVAVVREHPLRVPRVLLPAADREVGDRRRHRRRRPAPRRQRRRRRLLLRGAGHDRHPRRPLAHLSVGRQRRHTRRPRHQVGRARRRHPPGAAEQVPRRAGVARATSCTSSPGAAAAGATRSSATRSWSRWRCAAAWSPPRARGGTASASTEDGAVDGEATETLRDQMRADRPDVLPVFDMGPPIEELLERCEEETGLPAPKRPVWV